MKQWHTAILLAEIMGAIAMLFSHEARAEPVFGFGKWGGEIELDYEQDRQVTSSPGSPDLEFNRLRYDEKLGIRNQGFFIVDPRLFTGNLGLTFDLFQEHDRFDGNKEYQNGKLTGYNFDAGLLNEKPYSATIFANHNEDVSSREFGGRSAVTFESRGASLHLREDSFLLDRGIPYFNATLSVREEHTLEETTSFAQRFTRDETRDITTLDATKGFINADLGFRYEQTDVVDRVRPQSAFQTQAANLNYSLDFGPTLNRRWNSRVYFIDRTENSPATFLTVDEQLRIEHHQDLYTDYRYLFFRNDTQTGATTTQNGTFLVHQRIYKNLTTDYKLQGQTQDIPGGNRSYYAGQLDFNYRRSLTPDHHVFVHLGTRYQLDDNDLNVSQVNVIDEPHTAPSPLGVGVGFTLNNPFVIASTIVVLDSTRIAATPGVDYDIVQEGDSTKIVPITGSLIISPGENLFISYAFEVAPSIQYSTVSWWVSGGMDFRWIAVSYGHEEFDQTLLAGRDGRFLDDRRSDTAQLELRGDWGSTQARAGATYLTLDSTRLAYTRWQFSQLLAYRPRYDLLLSLNTEQSFTDYRLPERESSTHSARLSFDRFAPSGWYTTVYASTRTLHDSEQPDEILREAGLKARRSYAKLNIVPSLTWSDRERGGVETTDRRVEVKLTRRF
jgi:hypothetical protein